MTFVKGENVRLGQRAANDKRTGKYHESARVSVSGIGHSDIRELGRESLPYCQVNGPPRILPSINVDHKTERISEKCQQSYVVDSSNLS